MTDKAKLYNLSAFDLIIKKEDTIGDLNVIK